MTTTPPDNPRALSSEDGYTWQQSGSTRDTDWPTSPDPNVVKLVLGKRDEQSEAEPWQHVLDVLASNLGLKHQFPNLTHLHLWGLPLEKLGPLPEGLKVLDVRKCSKLSHLPELPNTLETLDLAECLALKDKALPKQGISGLRWFHVDGCVGISSKRISDVLEDCENLEEFTAKGCSQIVDLTLPRQDTTPPNGDWHPQFPPRRLKKLVLEGCSSLTKLPDLSVYPWLHHLNLNSCTSLTAMPCLPIGFSADGSYPLGARYLLTHDCQKISEFEGMDVRKVHLSRSDQDSVAMGFRTMQRLRDLPARFTRAKLLLLGSGRCGKTSLAKALQWNELDTPQRQKQPDLDPSKKQESTHGIQFWPWETNFEISSTDQERGHAHLWDFAGQEIYHNTHRLFASEGSVFFIVTTSEEEHSRRVDAEVIGLHEEEEKAFRRENEYREIKYWLDYLRTILRLPTVDDLGAAAGKVSIRIIFTGSRDADAAKETLLKQAGNYSRLLSGGDLPITALDFYDTGWLARFEEVSNWTRRALGRASDGYGRRVPGMYAKAAAYCEQQLARTGGTEILDFAAWESEIANLAHVPAGVFAPMLKREQARAVAHFLHQCGVVFWMKDKASDGDVIIHQRWGVNIIYGLLDWRKAGRFRKESLKLLEPERFEALLEQNDCYASLSLARRNTFLGFLDACDVCVRVGEHWMAAQRELLHEKTAEVEAVLEGMWNKGRSSADGMVNHCFAIHGADTGLLGNSDYRETLAFFVRGMHAGLGDRLFPARDPADTLAKRNQPQSDGANKITLEPIPKPLS